MIELTQEFSFDAAHRLPFGGSENQHIHGHSFYAEVTLRGEPRPESGILRDLGEVKEAVEKVRSTLDHHLLNDVKGLESPTLENLARYIFEQLQPSLPEIARVRLRRPSYGQSCTFEPSGGGR